jgi:hypothetical protein
VSAQFGIGGNRGGGPVHGGGPLLSWQHSQLPNDFNPVNHPFRPSEMTDNCLQPNSLGVVSGLNQAAADGVANQTCRFMNVEFLHEPCAVRFGGFYTDSQVHRDVLRGLSLTN